MTGDDAGNVWFGFSNNLVEWDGTGYQRFSFPTGCAVFRNRPCLSRGDRVWLGGSGGVELFTQGHFYVMRWKNQNLPGRVSGVLETQTGDLWMNGSSGITHVPAGELVALAARSGLRRFRRAPGCAGRASGTFGGENPRAIAG